MTEFVVLDTEPEDLVDVLFIEMLEDPVDRLLIEMLEDSVDELLEEALKDPVDVLLEEVLSVVLEAGDVLFEVVAVSAS